MKIQWVMEWWVIGLESEKSIQWMTNEIAWQGEEWLAFCLQQNVSKENGWRNSPGSTIYIFTF